MKIMVVGAGQVGTAVAKDLDEDHEIVVIDVDAEKLDELRYAADVMTYEGDAADLEVLEEAGTGDADMLIASTDDDRTNILVCSVGEVLSNSILTVARVADTDFLRTWQYTENAFNVDWMVGSDYLTAQTLVKIAFRHRAQAVEYFDRGRVEFVEFELHAGSDLAGKLVRDVDQYPGLRYAAVADDGDFKTVDGQTRIPEEGRILVLGRPTAVDEFARDLERDHRPSLDRVLILGGGEIGFQTARLFSERGVSPKIVERDPERADYLARNLPDSFVLGDDATDPEFLRSEGIDRSDLVISALYPDERNLFASLQAKELGASRVLSVVHEQQYTPLFEAYPVDAHVNPRNKVIEDILRHTRRGRIEKITFVENQEAEIIQLELDSDSPLVGRKLAESAEDLPDGLVIGAASRGAATTIPDGETVFQTGDRLVIYADSDVVEELFETI